MSIRQEYFINLYSSDGECEQLRQALSNINQRINLLQQCMPMRNLAGMAQKDSNDPVIPRLDLDRLRHSKENHLIAKKVTATFGVEETNKFAKQQQTIPIKIIQPSQVQMHQTPQKRSVSMNIRQFPEQSRMIVAPQQQYQQFKVLQQSHLKYPNPLDQNRQQYPVQQQQQQYLNNNYSSNQMPPQQLTWIQGSSQQKSRDQQSTPLKNNVTVQHTPIKNMMQHNSVGHTPIRYNTPMRQSQQVMHVPIDQLNGREYIQQFQTLQLRVPQNNPINRYPIQRSFQQVSYANQSQQC